MKKIIIFAYNILNTMLLPAYILVFVFRIFKGKDNISSVMKRFCFIKEKRPGGKIIWIHAASVGESMVALTLIDELKKKHKNSNFLVTTGTRSSSKILYNNLPLNAVHQYAPIDSFFIVKNFLNYWRPDLAIFVESEFWPCLISSSSAKCKMILVNARISIKSYKNWQKRKWLFQILTGYFDKIITQSESDLKKYQNLGVDKAFTLGNLKFSNKELEVNNEKLLELQNIFKKKKIFVASSTHRVDEKVTLEIILKFKQEKIDYYPVIILRHPERRNELADKCAELGLTYTIRSQGKLPDLNKDLYVVDTFGELGIFYSLAFITFVGGSFKNGGHNLLEPAYFNNIILLGPDMSNFKNISEEMVSNKAAIQIQNSTQLENKIRKFLSSDSQEMAKEYIENAQNFVENRKETLAKYTKQINLYIK